MLVPGSIYTGVIRRPQFDESIRYTWGEETRDEVLARLLELNRVMAAKEAEEAEAAKTNAALEKAEAPKAPKKAAAGKKRGKAKDEGALLFNLDEPGDKGSG
jgi:hypothetical protein